MQPFGRGEILACGHLEIVLAALDQPAAEGRPPRRPRHRRSARLPARPDARRGSGRSESPAASARATARRGRRVARISPSSTRLTVSRTGRPGWRAGASSSASMTRSISAVSGKGRAASWISTAPGRYRAKRLEPEPRPNPGAVGAARRPAAARCEPGDGASNRRSVLGRITTSTPAIRGCLAKAAIAWRSTLGPPSGRYCLGSSPPKRVPGRPRRRGHRPIPCAVKLCRRAASASTAEVADRAGDIVDVALQKNTD